jgi:hypothetical protein
VKKINTHFQELKYIKFLEASYDAAFFHAEILTQADYLPRFYNHKPINEVSSSVLY